MGVRVEVGEGESLPSALRRFRKYVRSANVMYEYRWHDEFTKRCEERRVQKGNAKRRAQGLRSWREFQREQEAKPARQVNAVVRQRRAQRMAFMICERHGGHICAMVCSHLADAVNGQTHAPAMHEVGFVVVDLVGARPGGQAGACHADGPKAGDRHAGPARHLPPVPACVQPLLARQGVVVMEGGPDAEVSCGHRVNGSQGSRSRHV